MLSLIPSFSLYLFHSLLEDLSPRTISQDYLAWWHLAIPSPPGRAAAPVSTVLPAAMEPWPVHRTCYLSQTCCFQLSRDTRSGRDILNDRLWKANWYLLLRCWHVAPLTTTVIIIIWSCWSSMNIWTYWPCSVYNLHPAQPEDWPPLIAWFISRFLPRFWPFLGVFPSHHASTPALFAVWCFRLGFCTALWDISWCKKGFKNRFDLFTEHVMNTIYLTCYSPHVKNAMHMKIWFHMSNLSSTCQNRYFTCEKANLTCFL